MIIVSVRDAAVKSFGTPMVFVNEAAAHRIFMNEVNREDPTNLLNANRSDFDLYHIANFDSDTGVVTAVEPSVILHGRDIGRKLSE